MEFPCNCGNPECKTKIHVENVDGERLLLTLGGKDEVESLMYLDANSIVGLIKNLQISLSEMVR
jgi:hypothetical protein